MTEPTASGQSLIDAHQHFWDGRARDQSLAAHAVFSTPYGPSELGRELEVVGVAGTVLIQSRNDTQENAAMASYAKSADYVLGAVYYLPLGDHESAMRSADEVARLPRARGVRCLVANEQLAWASAPETTSLWRRLASLALAWEVVPILAQQLTAVATVAAENPELHVVIDHLGRPPLPENGFEPWGSLIRDLGRLPNVSMKISIGIDVLQSWQQWDARLITRYVAHAVEHFGEDRLMLASNWPVVLMKVSYQRAVTDLVAAVKEVLGTDVTSSPIFARSAVRIFNLAAGH